MCWRWCRQLAKMLDQVSNGRTKVYLMEVKRLNWMVSLMVPDQNILRFLFVNQNLMTFCCWNMELVYWNNPSVSGLALLWQKMKEKLLVCWAWASPSPAQQGLINSPSMKWTTKTITIVTWKIHLIQKYVYQLLGPLKNL